MIDFAITGYLSYFILFLTFAGIYAVIAMGLNVQWGYTGMLNVGIAGFFAVGAYASAIATTPPTPDHLGGFGLPFLAGCLVAIVVSGILAVFIGLITLNLRSDYLAIASIGIAEIVRLFLKNEGELTNGVRGITDIPRPLAYVFQGGAGELAYMVIVFIAVGLVYLLVERAYRAPWGRVLRAIREKEPAAWAMGKNAYAFRLEAFVFGACLMGLGGALYAHFIRFIAPETFMPLFATFLVWVMLIAGGSGNNRGAILGAFVMWGVWSGTEPFLQNLLLPALKSVGVTMELTQASALRVLLIGVLLEVILVSRPQGLLPEKPPRAIAADDGAER